MKNEADFEMLVKTLCKNTGTREVEAKRVLAECGYDVAEATKKLSETTLNGVGDEKHMGVDMIRTKMKEAMKALMKH